MTPHATTPQHDAHGLEPEAIELLNIHRDASQRKHLRSIGFDFDQSGQLCRIARLVSSHGVEAVITEHCKPKPGFNETTATMDEIKDHFIERRIRERGTIEGAAQSLCINRSTIHWRKTKPPFYPK